jgi:hypothetical protein
LIDTARRKINHDKWQQNLVRTATEFKLIVDYLQHIAVKAQCFDIS